MTSYFDQMLFCPGFTKYFETILLTATRISGIHPYFGIREFCLAKNMRKVFGILFQGMTQKFKKGHLIPEGRRDFPGAGQSL